MAYRYFPELIADFEQTLRVLVRDGHYKSLDDALQDIVVILKKRGFPITVKVIPQIVTEPGWRKENTTSKS